MTIFITGVSALNLCLPNCSWAGDMSIDLYPWDAGTDDGISYMVSILMSIYLFTNSTNGFSLMLTTFIMVIEFYYPSDKFASTAESMDSVIIEMGTSAPYTERAP